MSKKSKKDDFDFSAFEADAIQRLLNGESLGGKDGILAYLVQRLLQAGLEGEMEAHLEEEPGNRRNGKGRKKVKPAKGRSS